MTDYFSRISFYGFGIVIEGFRSSSRIARFNRQLGDLIKKSGAAGRIARGSPNPFVFLRLFPRVALRVCVTGHGSASIDQRLSRPSELNI